MDSNVSFCDSFVLFVVPPQRQLGCQIGMVHSHDRGEPSHAGECRWPAFSGCVIGATHRRPSSASAPPTDRPYESLTPPDPPPCVHASWKNSSHVPFEQGIEVPKRTVLLLNHRSTPPNLPASMDRPPQSGFLEQNVARERAATSVLKATSSAPRARRSLCQKK